MPLAKLAPTEAEQFLSDAGAEVKAWKWDDGFPKDWYRDRETRDTYIRRYGFAILNALAVEFLHPYFSDS